MKKQILLLFFVFLLPSFPGLNAQKLIKERLFAGATIASDKVNRIFIPPPKEYFLKKGIKGGATIDFRYNGFNATAIASLEHAATILESILPEDVHIIINASWLNISTAGVLANSSTTGYALGGGIDALNPDAFYPVALAEKIAGEPLNDNSEGDIELNINSSVNWYYGIDGNTPTLRYDLVTVALHELIHGLGFFDSFFADAASGSYGALSIPLVYDNFVENFAGNRLTDTLLFLNPSASLKTQLTNGNLYFNGPVVRVNSGGGRARLYAPATYSSGSSIAHLDEDSYHPGDPNTNALMTPLIARGEAVHDPGKLTRAILGDIGWINTRIVQDPLRDTEEHITSITINTEIKSDTSYNHGKVGLTWSFDDFQTSNSLFMTSPGGNNSYTATIPVPAYETRLNYFFSVEDYFLRKYLSPSDTSFTNSVYIGIDTVKPVIIHTPEVYYFSVIDSIRFDVQAADNIGIDTVFVEYRLNAGTLNHIGLIHSGEFDYKAAINTKLFSITGGDSLEYRITAIDSSLSQNQKTLPASGFFSVRFEQIDPVAEGYSTNFSDAADAFIFNGFEITTPAGFTKNGLHTKHPYESPEETGDSIGYTAILRTPVRFDESGMLISFYEVVLIEPGEPGSTFGSSSFYDYVTVEGSSDFGKSWFRLTDGYDSRYMDAWETAYNSAILEGNSVFVGKASMLMKHTLFPKTSTFVSAGDTMLVRFRLFSDPYANGWGWGIEDLHIGPIINSVEDINLPETIIYPNPGNGKFILRQTEGAGLKPLKYSIFNSTGGVLFSDRTNGSPETGIDISAYPAGLYFIVLYHENGVQTLKYNLIK